MSDLKPAYLIWGDDEVKIDAWRRRLRSRAETEGPATTLEVLKGERVTPEAAASAIRALTLSVGRRYVLVDGVERWKAGDVAQVEDALAGLSPETVVVFIASHRSAARSAKPPPRLVKAIEGCGGEVHRCRAPRHGAYPVWVREQAAELGCELSAEAARTLVERIGCHQRRLTREIEKLAAFVGEKGRIGEEAVEALTASEVEARTYELADALIEGDGEQALRIAEVLRAGGEDMMSLLFALLRQLRSCQRAWAMLASGRPAGEIQPALRLPPFAARQVLAQARRADGERLERTLGLLAELDYAVRGAGTLDPETALTLTVARAGVAGPGAAAA